ncbi:hypothetical protein BMQ_pBM50006 (plasmid) [Priestia megaterium QM B1551]|uniref:Uncharacterized protein n=1 Tax=Priestia megaterium (strain ATCC 12872 / QMB1551) TaxID=545693 RepID=D5E3H0_PRIM1|nr:hypothetical protein BMQ_pBM50006 [Priestia megaterium QM B1551]
MLQSCSENENKKEDTIHNISSHEVKKDLLSILEIRLFSI